MILFCFQCRGNQAGGSQAGGAVFQERKYGVGMRVHNQTANKGQIPNYRCTVCTNERGKN